jgi:hypothetical protein
MIPAAPRHPVRSEAVWQPADIADPSDWTIQLTDSERDEIATAARAAVASGQHVSTLDADGFDLPTLSTRIREWSERLDHGRGFVLVRRFPVDLLTMTEVELGYVGLGAHIGSPVGQDKDSTLLGHVRDEGLERTGPEVRLYRTRARQDFHTDGADLVGLLCLHRARTGGQSRIASSAAVYNEMLRVRPDLVEVLFQPLYWDRNDEQSVGEDPFFELPVFSDNPGGVGVFYIGWYIRDAQRHPQVPRLTSGQLEAMDLLESIANDPAFHLEMDFEPGDIQFLNNARILHAREAYEDHNAPAARRHLLRLWLAAHRFSAVAEPIRAGIPRQQRS